jgi:hypothetical protein
MENKQLRHEPCDAHPLVKKSPADKDAQLWALFSLSTLPNQFPNIFDFSKDICSMLSPGLYPVLGVLAFLNFGVKSFHTDA